MTPKAKLATQHYAVIDELSTYTETRELPDTTVSEQTGFNVGPEFLLTNTALAPFVLVGVFFVIIFGAFIMGRLRHAKITAATLVIILFALSIPLVTNFLKTGERTVTNAGPNEVPRNVQIEHTSDSSVTISWETLTPQTGFIRYGEGTLSDTNSKTLGDITTKSTTHAVTLPSLKDNSRYEIQIFSAGEWYGIEGFPISFTFFASGPK